MRTYWLDKKALKKHPIVLRKDNSARYFKTVVSGKQFRDRRMRLESTLRGLRVQYFRGRIQVNNLGNIY